MNDRIIVLQQMQLVAIEHPCWVTTDAQDDRFEHRFIDGVTVTVNVLCDDTAVESYGGPIWHASAWHPVLHRDVLSGHALTALDGVGDATLGESRVWNDQATGLRLDPEWIGNQFDVFRRLTPTEALLAGKR